MSDAADIYVKYAGPIEPLARRLAEAVGAPPSGDLDGGFVIPLDAEGWVGVPGWAHLDLRQTETGEDGHAEFNKGQVQAPYEYVVTVEMRGPVDRLTRMIFDRLVGLGLPLVYVGTDTNVLADFLPGRGVREFPAGTHPDESGRALWYVPELHDDPAAPWHPKPAPPA